MWRKVLEAVIESLYLKYRRVYKRWALRGKPAPAERELLREILHNAWELKYFGGGFWSYPGAIWEERADYYVPDWWVSDAEVRALARKGLIEIKYPWARLTEKGWAALKKEVGE